MGPKLNIDIDQNGPQITLEEVDKLLKEQNDIACSCSDFVDREEVDGHEVTESQRVLFDMSYMNLSADNVINITLGQIDYLSDLDLASSNQDNNQPESCSNESLRKEDFNSVFFLKKLCIINNIIVHLL